MEVSEIKEEFVTGREAARALGVSEQTFYRKKREGLIPAPFLLWGGPKYRLAEILAVKETIRRRRGKRA